MSKVSSVLWREAGDSGPHLLVHRKLPRRLRHLLPMLRPPQTRLQELPHLQSNPTALATKWIV